MSFHRTSICCAGVILLALPLALAACAHHDPDNAPPLIAEPASPISDAPIPVGFRMMVGQSTSQVVPSSSLRFVDHSYSGSSSQLQCVKFYRDEMPKRGWTFISQDQSHKEITLKFTKNNEDALVMVGRGTFDMHIRIKINPSNQNAGK